MKIGFSGNITYLKTLDSIGYELLEVGVPQVSSLTDEEFHQLKQNIADGRIDVVSCNMLMSASVLLPLYEDQDLACSTAYLERVMPILADLGIKMVVFGSGRFRKMPAGTPSELEHDLVSRYLTMAESLARRYNMLLLIEPLNLKETNVIRTTKDAVDYIRELNLPNLKLVVDLYHFWQEGEPMERILEYKDYIQHVHIAEPTKRDFLMPDDAYDYKLFFEALNAIGYDGAVIFEGGKSDFDAGIRSSYHVLRQLVKK